jgi:NADPH:quinone reductase-like Zn-dependent oxidoreductase
LPITLGWDLSGTVQAIDGTDTPYRVGEAVFGFVCFPDEGATYAEYAAVPAAQLAPKPRSLGHVAAAGVPLAGLTAWQALFDVAQLLAGQTVLVHAAAGGVGHVAVQLAKWQGATVIGTASGRNASFLRQLGVDQMIDYTSTRFQEVTPQVDVVLDPIGGETRQRSWGVLKKGGLLVGLVDRASAEAAPEGKRGRYMLAHPDGEQLAEISRLIDAGHLKPAVDKVFSLNQAASAHELGQTGHTRGKIVLRIIE